MNQIDEYIIQKILRIYYESKELKSKEYSRYRNEYTFENIIQNKLSDEDKTLISDKNILIKYLINNNFLEVNERGRAEPYQITKIGLNYLFENRADNGHNKSITQMGKIFISHSSKDEDIVNLFVKEILKIGLEVSSDEIFCTSIEGSNIKSGEDFKKRIKEEIQTAKIIIQILTPNYKKSEICLNEMGAAWVLHDKVIPFILSNEYDTGFIHGSTQQLRLNNEADLNKFYDDIKEYLNKHTLKSAVFQKALKDYISQLSKLTNYP